MAVSVFLYSIIAYICISVVAQESPECHWYVIDIQYRNTPTWKVSCVFLTSTDLACHHCNTPKNLLFN
jgi:hypothetical protein